MKALYSFINAVLFYKNRLTSDCRKQEPPSSISLLLYNLLIIIVTSTNSVSFAKRHIFKKKIGMGPAIFQETSKIGACSGFLEVKHRPWLVAHTRIPDIRKFPSGVQCVSPSLNLTENFGRQPLGCLQAPALTFPQESLISLSQHLICP